MKRTLSCDDLQHSVFAGPDVLRHCCKRFFVDGKMKGDVEIYKVNSDADISYEKIIEHKKKLHEEINQGHETPCTGCPWLREDEWLPIEKDKISHISIEPHSVCNLKCTYCSDEYYGGKKSLYDVIELCRKMDQQHAISENVSFVWGGGEPVLLKSFEQVFSTLTEKYRPVHNNVFTNAIIYSPSIATYLERGMATITTSIDAGTAENYKAIRGRDKLQIVLENLKKYHERGGDRVTVKYILMPENSSERELEQFTDKIAEYGLEKCSFQISADYKNETIGDEAAKMALFLFHRLKKLGSSMINFDDHLRPRINTRKDLLMESGAGIKTQSRNIVIWGAGSYARRMLEDSTFFHNDKIKFFVDKDPSKQGKTINGIEIKSPREILSEQEVSIFIASTIHYRIIYSELLEMGVAAENILDANVL